MATWLKSANFNGYNGGNFYIALYYDILSQSQINNSSSVRYYLYAGSANGYSGSGNTAIAKINGSAVNAINSIGVNAYFLVGQLDTTIWHDDNGNATASYSANIQTTWGGVGSAELNGSFALPKIDRYPQILTAPNFDDESNPTITYSTVLGFENATVSACISLDRTSADVPYREVNVESGQYTFELTNAERTTLRNATTTSNTRTVYFFLRTQVQGLSEPFYSVVERTLSIVNANPTFTHTEVETNSGVINVLGSSGASTVIQNASVVQTTITPTALKGASITSVRVTSGTYAETKTSSPYVFDIPITVSSFIITVFDSRGNSSGVGVPKTLIEYIPVNLNSISLARENPTSSNIILNLNGDYLQKTFNSTANVPTVKWKLEDGSFNTIPSSAYTIADGKITISNYEFTNALVYTSAGRFTIELSDLLTTDTESDIVVLKGIPTFDYGEHDLKVNGNLYVADQDGENAKDVMEQLTWNYLDSSYGSAAINLPSEFHELLCIINVGGNSTMNFEMVIPYDFLTTTEQGFNNGYYATSSGNAYCRVLATQTSAKIGASYFNTTNVLSSSTLYIYYR